MKLQTYLPLVTHPDCNADAIAENAASVAAWLDATLHVRVLNAAIPVPSSALSGILVDVPKLVRDAEAQSRKFGERLQEKVATAAARRDVTFVCDVEAAPIAMLGERAALHARYHDLAVVGLEAGNPTSRMTAEALIFGAGRPTVVLPETAGRQRFANVAIAWDGTRAAARAVADGLPFLERSSRVHVLTVVGEKRLEDDDAGARLASGLRERGFAADAAVVQAEDCPVAVTLQEHALAAGADLLVMGGYGHSRLRDFVLGGATQGALDDLRLPTLMSH